MAALLVGWGVDLPGHQQENPAGWGRGMQIWGAGHEHRADGHLRLCLTSLTLEFLQGLQAAGLSAKTWRPESLLYPFRGQSWCAWE